MKFSKIWFEIVIFGGAKGDDSPSPFLFMVNTELKVIFEDKYLLAVNKQHGIVVEKEPHLKYTLESLALQYIRAKERYPQKCFIGLPHRLDRPVSGVVLFAKKRSTLKALVESFAKREVEKTYFAVVKKRPEKDDDELTHWLVKDMVQRKAILHSEQVDNSVRAVLRYKFIQQNEFGSLLQIKLITGKFHQIRAQLSQIGSPIFGDVHYGSDEVYKENAIALHAHRLALMHPATLEKIEFTADFPDDKVWNSFEATAPVK